VTSNKKYHRRGHFRYSRGLNKPIVGFRITRRGALLLKVGPVLLQLRVLLPQLVQALPM
jgi:hypothetical protein